MLGISKFKQENLLNQTATALIEHFIAGSKLDNDLLDRLAAQYKLENVSEGQNIKGFEVNIDFNTNIDPIKAALHAIRAWQLCDIKNNVLISPKFQFIGWGGKFGLYHSYTGANEEAISGYFPTKGLYVTQHFLSVNERVTILSEINITKEIKSHLNKYGKLLGFELNKSLIEESSSHGCEPIKKIKNNRYLNKIAKQQILTALKPEKDLDEEIQDKYKDIVEHANKGFSSIRTKLIRLSNYIPACRLVNKLDSFSDEIRTKIQSREFNTFGVKVALFENKCFLVSVIFAKKKKMLLDCFYIMSVHLLSCSQKGR
ncbi:hypothetical protein CDIK_1031 [Cucumispora dikerogammari]|nr:hypothetical protein CDIK_1031 [Cucumispora dikerogammari]